MSARGGRTLASVVVLGLLAVSLSAGCGTRVGPLDDPNAVPAKPTPTQPVTAPATTSPTPAPTPVVPVPTAQLQIAQKEFKSQPLGWFGKPWIEVTVSNPGATTLAGLVKISFTDDKGTSTGDDQEKAVSLGGNQTQTLKFTATKGNPKKATFTVTADAPAGGAPAVPPADPSAKAGGSLY